DRFGWAKWSFRSCAEWLAWRCGITLSAAREKVRTAQALRGLPQISGAFADGRLSYSKVRALTRAADRHNEGLLLAYAL
ncbi:HNH endonuclease, partial [Enterococcus hirae]